MTKSRRSKLITLAIIIAFTGLLVLGKIITSEPKRISALKGFTATVYRTASCGCCKNYAKYLENAGLAVEEKIVSDNQEIMTQLGVPQSMSSCHTTQINDYIVEGHIPIEAIEKLVADKPEITGIGMPGMPAGSPGMPGKKIGTFAISSFTADGIISPFLSL